MDDILSMCFYTAQITKKDDIKTCLDIVFLGNRTGRRRWRLARDGNLALHLVSKHPCGNPPMAARERRESNPDLVSLCSTSSKRISRGLNTRASLCEDDILSMDFQTIQLQKKNKEHFVLLVLFW